MQRFGAIYPGKGTAQRQVDVDVGCAEPDFGRTEAGTVEVEPGVNTVACGERLEPQPIATGGHDGIQIREPLGKSGIGVAACGDVGDGEQTGGGNIRAGDEAGEEDGIVDSSAGRDTERGREVEMRAVSLFGQRRLGHIAAHCAPVSAATSARASTWLRVDPRDSARARTPSGTVGSGTSWA